MASEADHAAAAWEIVPSLAERFRTLSAAERFAWWVGMLRLAHALSTPEARERWRQRDHRDGES